MPHADRATFCVSPYPLLSSASYRKIQLSADTRRPPDYHAPALESPQPIHRDDWLYGQFPFPPGYTGIIQSMWALTPFTKENGATLYVPGSHALPELTQIVREGKRDRLDYAMNSAPGTIRFTPDDAVQMTMDEGSKYNSRKR